MAKQLLAGEAEIRTVRQHWYVFIPAVLAVALALAAIAILLAVTPGDVGGHSLRTVKAAILVAALLVIAVTATLRYLRWHFSSFTLTSHRVLVNRGVITRFTEAVALDRIQDVSARQGIVGRIFHAGTLEIESAGRDGGLLLRNIPDPVGFSNAVQFAAQAMRTGQPPPGAAPWSPAPGGYVASPGYVPPAGGGYAPPPPGYNPPSQGGI